MVEKPKQTGADDETAPTIPATVRLAKNNYLKKCIKVYCGNPDCPGRHNGNGRFLAEVYSSSDFSMVCKACHTNNFAKIVMPEPKKQRVHFAGRKKL